MRTAFACSWLCRTQLPLHFTGSQACLTEESKENLSNTAHCAHECTLCTGCVNFTLSHCVNSCGLCSLSCICMYHIIARIIQLHMFAGQCTGCECVLTEVPLVVGPPLSAPAAHIMQWNHFQFHPFRHQLHHHQHNHHHHLGHQHQSGDDKDSIWRHLVFVGSVGAASPSFTLIWQRIAPSPVSSESLAK